MRKNAENQRFNLHISEKSSTFALSNKKTKCGLTHTPTPDADGHRCYIARVGVQRKSRVVATFADEAGKAKKVPEKAWAYYALPASDKEKNPAHAITADTGEYLKIAAKVRQKKQISKPRHCGGVAQKK